MQSGSDLGYRNSPRSLTHARMNTLLTQSSPCEVSQSPGSLTASCVCLELRPLPSPGVTRLQRYYTPLRHPTVPSLSLTGVWLVIPDRALGLPVLRALSLCTCCRQYPGAVTGRRLRSSHPAVSAFPEIAVGSACTSSFSRLARRSLALRPAHSRRHLYVTCYTEGFSHFVSSMTAPDLVRRKLVGALPGNENCAPARIGERNAEGGGRRPPDRPPQDLRLDPNAVGERHGRQAESGTAGFENDGISSPDKAGVAWIERVHRDPV